MEKNSSLEVHKPVTRQWKVGDLVKISELDWDATTSYNKGLGIIVSVTSGLISKQMDLFPMIEVYNLNTSKVSKIYSYNLEIVSSSQ